MKLNSTADVPDALSKGMSNDGLILSEENLPPAFFDLKSGLAGELLQKFTNYRVPLALVVKNPSNHGKRFEELARELQSHPITRLFPTTESAEAWLGAQQKLD